MLYTIIESFKLPSGKYNPRCFNESYFIKLGYEHEWDEYSKLQKLYTNGPAQIAWHLINKCVPVCKYKMCDNQVNWNKRNKQYRDYCSSACANLDSNRAIKISNSLKQLDKLVLEPPTSTEYIYDTSEADAIEFIMNNCIRKDRKINQQWSKMSRWENQDLYKFIYNYAIISPAEKTFSRVVSHLMLKSRNIPKCGNIECDKHVSYDNATSKYRLYCSNKCVATCRNIKEAKIATIKQKYGVDDINHIRMLPKSVCVLQDKGLFESALNEVGSRNLAIMLEVDYNTIMNRCKRYNINNVRSKISSPELRLKQVLDDIGVEYIHGDRCVIAPYEIDFYLPEFSTAIECNGLYWHTVRPGNIKNKNYHHRKWKACREKNISLYNYTDTDILKNVELIKKKIEYITHNLTSVVGARQCTVSPVTANDEFDLLDKYHIQGALKSRSKSLGAYYNDDLVAVINWTKRKQYLEITRYCCNCDSSYPGLFSKMLSEAIAQEQYTGPIVSFSNNDHSNGNLYKAAGFEIDKILGPAYWYTKDYKELENRQRYTKAKIAKKFNIDMANKTEWQAMQELGYARYYDSGKIKWKKEV